MIYVSDNKTTKEISRKKIEHEFNNKKITCNIVIEQVTHIKITEEEINNI